MHRLHQPTTDSEVEASLINSIYDQVSRLPIVDSNTPVKKSHFEILVQFDSSLLNFVVFDIDHLIAHLSLKLFLIHNSFEEHGVLVFQTRVLFD